MVLPVRYCQKDPACTLRLKPEPLPGDMEIFGDPTKVYRASVGQGMLSLAGTLQAVVVAPSRELAMQITRVGQSILPNEARGCVQQAIGGANPRRQVCHGPS